MAFARRLSNRILIHFAQLPPNAERWVRMDGFAAQVFTAKKWGKEADGSDHWTKPDPTRSVQIPLEQSRALVAGLRARGITKLDGVFIDFEESSDMAMASDYLRQCLAPFTRWTALRGRMTARIVDFNGMAASGKMWWGQSQTGIIAKASDVQLYTGWYEPGQPVPPERAWVNEPAAMANSMAEGLATLWGNRKAGETFAHLPVCHHDPDLALALTRVATIAALGMGCRLMYAPYMADDPERMVGVIRGEMERFA